MAIYRPSRPRWPAAAAAGVAGALVGLLAGIAMSQGGEQDPVDALRRIAGKLAEAAGVVEVAGIEYAEAVSDGEVVEAAEYGGSLDALARSRALYSEVAAAVRFARAEDAAAIEDAFAEARRLMQQKMPAEEVGDALSRLEAALEGVFGD